MIVNILDNILNSTYYMHFTFFFTTLKPKNEKTSIIQHCDFAKYIHFKILLEI